jgi:hypothetical protein
MILARMRRCHGARVLRSIQQVYHLPAIRISNGTLHGSLFER